MLRRIEMERKKRPELTEEYLIRELLRSTSSGNGGKTGPRNPAEGPSGLARTRELDLFRFVTNTN